MLESSGEHAFSFRDVVTWWETQAQRGWLFLLDDAAFKERQAACAIFLRNDPDRLGKVTGDKLSGVIRGLRSADFTKKTEAACREGACDSNTLLLVCCWWWCVAF